MDKKPISIKLNDKLRFGAGSVIAIYGNAARDKQGLGRCMAVAAINGNFGPFSTDGERVPSLYLFDTLSNDFETRVAMDEILDIAENPEGLPEGLKVWYKSAINCAYPKDIQRLIAWDVYEYKPDILIISGAEDILEDTKSLASLRTAFRWFKRMAEAIKGIVILEFGINPSHMIKGALIDKCNYAFLTDGGEGGRITATATKWEGEPIPTMYIDTDPEEGPAITIDEAEEE